MQDITVILSNRVEALYSHLLSNLQQKSGAFRRRLCVVPGAAMERYLRWRLCEDLGIAAGIEFLGPRKAISFLHRYCFPHVNVQSEPEQADLAFALESFLENRLGTPLSPKKLARIADEVARCFLHYGMYASSDLENWDGDWQADVWRCVMDGRVPYGMYLEYLMEHVPERDDVDVFIFGQSFLPRQQYRFFSRLAKHFPVTYYALSPCRMYWGESLSEKEGRRLAIYLQNRGLKTEELEGFLRDCNPLLANYGKLGREFLEILEKENYQFEEYYVTAPWVKSHVEYSDAFLQDVGEVGCSSKNVLDAVHADILFIRKPPEPMDLSEGNIEGHLAPTKLREIEVLHDNLLRIMERCPEIKPSDIVVMAPEIGKYAPAIRSVFSGAPRRLGSTISDIDFNVYDEGLSVFWDILSLASGRFDSQAVNRLFQTPCFSRSCGFNEEDIVMVSKWIEESSVTWGLDERHKRRRLEDSLGEDFPYLDGAGTWQSGLDSLLLSVVEVGGAINYPDAELLGRFVECVKEIAAILDPILEGRKQTPRQWAALVSVIVSRYLSASSSFDSMLQELAKMQSVEMSEISPIAFETFSYQLARIFRNLNDGRQEHGTQVHFCSLLPLRGVPAAVVCLLGMGENYFPRRESRLHWDKFRQFSNADYRPSQGDFDRYLFLEALLSARNFFFLSATKSSEAGFSSVVEELFNYLDVAYTIDGSLPSKILISEHPVSACNPVYFSESSKYKSYSLHGYRVAKASLVKCKNQRMFSHFHLPRQVDRPEEVSIRALASSFGNPVKHYLREALGLYFPRELTRNSGFSEKFGIDALDMGLWRRQFFDMNVSDAVHEAMLQGRLPNPVFSSLVCWDLQESWSEMQKLCRDWKMDGQSRLFIEFSRYCGQPEELGANHWILPSPQVGGVAIVGRHTSSFLQGVLDYRKGDFQDLVRIYPQLVLHCYVAEQIGKNIDKRVLSLRSGKVFECNMDWALELEKILGHFLTMSNTLCPLPADLLNALLANQQSVLKRNPDPSCTSPELVWLFQQQTVEDIVRPWENYAKDVFGELFLRVVGS